MQKFDVLIVGGGMVGLTLALAIRKQSDLTVALADTQALTELTDQPETRVSAINAASQQIFTRLNVWDDIVGQRSQPYHHMHIWDKAGYGKLDFNLADVSGSSKPDQLGWIIENKVIRNALWHKAQMDEGISFFTDEAIASIGVGESEVFASFGSSMPITAKLLVGADGANSWVRKQINMPITFRDYDHHALVATVSCEQGHQDTAWQVFLPTGPLAFLPLYQQNLCSIVWSTSPEEAQRLRALDKAAFGKEITAATDGKLGRVNLESELGCYPLMMRLAQDFVKDKVVLIGDAAHTIHPLAGQGVNLGLLDAAALAQTLTGQLAAEQSSLDNISNEILLKQFARWRKSEAAEMIAAMEAIKQLFTPQQEVSKFIRGIGMSLLDNFSPAKKQLIRQALGYKGKLPELAKSVD
ncbi:FAD-dependent monooxygenase [Thalassomonas actiniarum]|uniref:FAD-dependent monooxygenase n=1 Tax=Thalassomonas actiniarum TaxID=485447 RepID=A0AAF0C2Q5_9GAMM|nr:FAD-dependent monooxygenase [Thalassomonas actiniarum]WDD97899.1 FAD-dependent monooxygenase [Thalassomonas actiniarum]